MEAQQEEQQSAKAKLEEELLSVRARLDCIEARERERAELIRRAQLASQRACMQAPTLESLAGDNDLQRRSSNPDTIELGSQQSNENRNSNNSRISANISTGEERRRDPLQDKRGLPAGSDKVVDNEALCPSQPAQLAVSHPQPSSTSQRIHQLFSHISAAHGPQLPPTQISPESVSSQQSAMELRNRRVALPGRPPLRPSSSPPPGRQPPSPLQWGMARVLLGRGR